MDPVCIRLRLLELAFHLVGELGTRCGNVKAPHTKVIGVFCRWAAVLLISL